MYSDFLCFVNISEEPAIVSQHNMANFYNRDSV